MITVRYFAAARDAAGRDTDQHPPASLGALLNALATGRPALAAVFDRSSYLVDGVAAHDRERPLPAGATVDVLPPFAGG